MSDARSSDVREDCARPPRTIVLCFDGTNQQYESTNTNVVKFFGLLSKDCPDKQAAYYQAGIGTYYAPGVVSPLWTKLASLLDDAFAWYLDAHVKGGYQYLMDNYCPGDKICLFGFSRGAYTARALAGMLYKVGLLPRDNLEQIDFAYKAYNRSDEEGIKLAAGFKKTFSQDVKVELVGVWDTVQSTGFLVSRMLPFTDSNHAVKVFRHALSLDEHRARFRPNLYHWPAQADKVTSSRNAATRMIQGVKSTLQRLYKKSSRVRLHQTLGSGSLADGAQRNGIDEVISNTEPDAESVGEETFPCTDVLEVWFSGCHGDIGGGDVEDGVEVSLAQITLHWMVEQVIQSQCGILFDSDGLACIGFTVPPNSPQPPATRGQVPPDSDTNDIALVASGIDTTLNATDISARVKQKLLNEPKQPTPGSGSYSEHLDAIAPLFDQLKLNKLWWLLEIIPCSNAWQDANGVWHNKWSVNLGRGRFIPFQKPKFHHTVKERMNYEPLKYKPRANWGHDEVYV